MKRKGLCYSVLVLALIGMLLPSCKADVDMEHMDTTMGAQLGLALPIGSFTATVDDFLGTGNLSDYIEMDSEGDLFYTDTMRDRRSYYKINLENYLTNVNQRFDIESPIPGSFPISIPAGYKMTLDFPVTITMNGVNTLLAQERIDRILVDEAIYSSIFSIHGLNINFSDIKSVKLIMDENFSSENYPNNIVELDLQGKGFGQNIPIELYDFYLNFIADKNKDESNLNVVSTIKMTFVFDIEVGSSGALLQDDAYINCDFQINLMTYHAIWGWFAPSNMMSDERAFCLADEWAEWETLSDLKLPFAEPTIQLNLYHSIGVPLMLYGEYLYVTDADGNKRDATFNGNKSWLFPMENYVSNYTIGMIDSVLNTYTFTKDPQNGAINKLFEIHPDTMAYKYKIYPDNTTATAMGIKSYHLSENTDISFEAIVKLPLIFDPGVDVSYDGNIEANLSVLEIDSLIASINAIDDLSINDLKLYIIADNSIPFDINCTFEFRDSLDNVLPIKWSEDGNVLPIESPLAENIVNGVVTQSQRTTATIDLGDDQVNILSKTRTIHFICTLGDNVEQVRVKPNGFLKLNMALAADVSAVLDLLDENNKEE